MGGVVARRPSRLYKEADTPLPPLFRSFQMTADQKALDLLDDLLKRAKAFGAGLRTSPPSRRTTAGG